MVKCDRTIFAAGILSPQAIGRADDADGAFHGFFR